MKFSKLSSVFCLLAVGTLGFTLRAEDTPAQAAARIAIAKTLFEVSAASATNTPATNAMSVKAAKAKAKQEAAQAAAEAKAKQDADKKLADQQAAQAQAAGDQATAKVKADKAAAEAQAKQAAAQAAADAKAKQDAEKKLADQQAAQAKARAKADKVAASAAANKDAKLTAKAKQENQGKPSPAVPAGQAATPPEASKPGNSYEGAELGLKPIAPPALPISANKADRLAALLVKYQADQITPEEYHQQRAAILAEP